MPRRRSDRETDAELTRARTDREREYTGNALLCEDVLLDSGVTDLSVYDCVPGGELGVDLWVDTPNPPGYKGP